MDHLWRREEEFFLTDCDCSDNRRHNNRQCHTTSYDQVPLVFGDVFALVAVMDLKERKTVKTSE